MPDVSGWEFGWDALVAVGTLTLALVTGGLTSNDMATSSIGYC